MWEFVENHLIKCNQPSAFQPSFTCSKLTIETLEEHIQSWGRSAVFIVNFEHISHLFLVFLLTLNI